MKTNILKNHTTKEWKEETHKRVDLFMTLRVMLFDMLELCSLPKCRYRPVEVSQPFVQSWVTTSDVADVALEVLLVDALVYRKL